MTVGRLLVTDEARDLIQLTRDVADKVLAPIVDIHEIAENIPRESSPRSATPGCSAFPIP